MQVSRDIHLEKALEAMLEQYAYEIGEEAARNCPILQNMIENIQYMKSSNNAEIRVELGIVGNCGRCPMVMNVRKRD